MIKTLTLATALTAALVLPACASDSAQSNVDTAITQTTAAAENNITNYETAGNLEATNPLSCEPATDVQPTSSAADVVAGAVACTEEDKFDEAVELVLVSSAYAFYDTQRVADPSAHSALQALFTESFASLSEEDLGQVNSSMGALTPDNPRHQALCESLVASGPPTYYPGYMIAHGLGAVSGAQESPMIEDLDVEESWAKSLEFVNCSN